MKQQLVDNSNSSSCKCNYKTNDSTEAGEDSKTSENTPIKEEVNQDSQDEVPNPNPKNVVQVIDDAIMDPIAISTSNNVELMMLQTEIEELTEQLELQRKMIQKEKQNSAMYSRFYHKINSVEKEQKSVQTNDEENSADFTFFEDMVESTIKQCIESRDYKVVKPDFKLKNKHKKELMLDFLKFKNNKKDKIQKIIDKTETALEIKQTIEQFVQKRELEEGKGIKKDDAVIEQEKAKVIEKLKDWSGFEDAKDQFKKLKNTKKNIAENNDNDERDFTFEMNEDSKISDLNTNLNNTPFKTPQPNKLKPLKVISRDSSKPTMATFLNNAANQTVNEIPKSDLMDNSFVSDNSQKTDIRIRKNSRHKQSRKQTYTLKSSDINKNKSFKVDKKLPKDMIISKFPIVQ